MGGRQWPMGHRHDWYLIPECQRDDPGTQVRVGLVGYSAPAGKALRSARPGGVPRTRHTEQAVHKSDQAKLTRRRHCSEYLVVGVDRSSTVVDLSCENFYIYVYCVYQNSIIIYLKYLKKI